MPSPPPPPGLLEVNRTKTVFARHVGFYPEDLWDEVAHPHARPCLPSGTGTGTAHYPPPPLGTPIVAILPAVVCTGAIPDLLGARHLDHAGGRPRVAYTFTCCDAVDAELVEPTCNGGVGLPPVIYAYLANVSNCVSANGRRVKLTYSGEAWFGSAGLRGGTLNLKFTCSGHPTGTIADSYRLDYWGCQPECDDPTKPGVGTGSVACSPSYTVVCDDPLILLFAQLRLDRCCDCPDDSTDTAAEVNVTVVANCRRVVAARHVGYATGSLGQAVPLVAMVRDCDSDGSADRGCSDVYCGLHVTVTGSGDCACLSDSGVLIRQSGQWVGAFGHCGGALTPADYVLSCVDNCDGTVTYRLSALCGATNTGGPAYVTIRKEDVEDLDITFQLNFVDPFAAACIGNCESTYNAMTATWTNTGSTCSEGCDPCPETPPAPYLPGSPSDGQVVSFPCSGAGVPVPCCVGPVSVRVMRL